MDIEKDVYISQLLDIYGGLLTKKQYLIMDSYYNYDLSLSEIAQNQDISRSAVLDAITKSSKNLKNYEDKLHIFTNKKETLNLLSNKGVDEKIIDEIRRKY